MDRQSDQPAVQAAETQHFVDSLTRWQGPLHAFIASLMPGSPEIADVLQETNLTLWKKMAEFEPGSNFQAWAFQIARYKVLQHRRRQKDSKLVFSSDDLLERIGEAASRRNPRSYDAKVRALNACVEDLRPKSRELIETRYESRETLEHYAKRIGRSANSLYVTLGRIRAALKRCVESRLKKEGWST